MSSLTELRNAERRQLGTVLLEQGAITQDQLQIALREQRDVRKPLGTILIDLGFVTDSIVRDALSANTGHRAVDLRQTLLDADTIRIGNHHIARMFKGLPLSYDAEFHQLYLAMAHTFNIDA